ncbi:MAG: ATP-binding protein [Deltaproteobacteria bacterium]|nr:ATP-binding protein [Deltaproteobacteria bacterium]
MKRTVDPSALLSKKSHFLFGPRGVGKSFLIRQMDKNKVDTIDLLRSQVYLDLQRDPSQLENYIKNSLVVIDEVQRIPELLNEVHRLIEEQQKKFLLTGSSARKLKRTGVNLLAGRAYKASLFGLTWNEIIQHAGSFDLDRYLLYGGLPTAYLEEDPADYLYAYTDTYLREEIQAEALVRQLSNYSRFLDMAAKSNAELVNYSKIGNDAQVAPNTVRDYYQLLEDTLMGQNLPPWTKSVKRKAIQTAKFYFFDPGLVHSLKKMSTLERNSGDYGKAFEHFLYCEIRSALSYLRCRKEFCFWRSKNNQEVDFIIGDDTAIEVKASRRVTERDHKGLRAIAEEKTWKHLLLVSQDKTDKRFPSGVRHLHWEDFLRSLWQGLYFPEKN